MFTPRITLDQWRAFHAVVTYGGYAQAANALNRSQSAISYNVQQLQSQLGLQLLEIRGRRAELTGIGQVMLTRAQHLLQQAQDLETFAAAIEQGWEPEIRLVVDAAFPSDTLMQCLAEFSSQCPNIRVRLNEVVLSGAEEALQNGDAELVIGGIIPKGRLEDTLLRLSFIAVAHPDHALHALNRKLSEHDLSLHTQVVIRDSGTQFQLDSGWLNAENRWSVGSIQKSIDCLTAGLGFAWLPQHDIRRHLEDGSLKPLMLEHGASYDANLYLLFADVHNPGPGTRKLAQIIRDRVSKQNR